MMVMDALLPSSSISPRRISTILQSHVYPRFGRVLRALARVKSALLLALAKAKWPPARRRRHRRRRRRKQQQQQHARAKKTTTMRTSGSSTATNSGGGGGGFAKTRPPHLTWSDSAGGGLLPARTVASMDVSYHVYHHHPSSYESAVWNAVVVPVSSAPAGGEYCGYLRWLEEEGMQIPDDEAPAVVVDEEDDEEGEEEEEEEDDDADGNEIDRLAEQFIARCRANFLMEKQESYDRCQEMIARSL